MSVSPITYENFQTASQIWAGDGGPWKGTYEPMDVRVMPLVSSSEGHCNGSCLIFSLAARPPVPIYQLTATANVSVDMTQYGSANNLDFVWTFWPGYNLPADLPAEISVPIHTQINDVGLDDSVLVLTTDFNTNPDGVWAGNLISRTGTVSLTSGPGSSSFISIVMSLTTLPTNTTFTELSIKDISFKITNPTILASSSLLSSSSTSSGSLLTFTSGGPSAPLSDSSTSPQPSSTGSAPSSETAKISTAAIGGLTVGVVILVTLLVIGFLFYQKRKNKNASSDPLAYEPITYGSNTYPMEKYPLSGSNGITPSSSVPYQIPIIASQITSIPAPTPANPIAPLARSTYSTYGAGTSAMGREPLPVYDNAGAYVLEGDDETEDPSPLAVFANAHRELISEDLEARLEAAGYLPTVDPDNLTEEEWLSLHNVTKLEVMRLQRLYQMERQPAN